VGIEGVSGAARGINYTEQPPLAQISLDFQLNNYFHTTVWTLLYLFYIKKYIWYKSSLLFNRCTYYVLLLCVICWWRACNILCEIQH